MLWENFIRKIHHNVHGRQTINYKFLKSKNCSIRDTESINTITNTNWIEHYKSILDESEKEVLIDIGDTDIDVSLIRMRKFQETFKQLRKSGNSCNRQFKPWKNKYGGNIFHQCAKLL